MNKQIIKPKVVSLIFKEGSTSMNGVVKINDKDYLVNLSLQYIPYTEKNKREYGDYSIFCNIIGFSISTMEVMGNSLDISEVKIQYIKKLEERKVQQEKERVEAKRKKYLEHPLHKVLKSFPGFKVSYNEKDFIENNCTDIDIKYKEEYKNHFIECSISIINIYSTRSFRSYVTGHKFKLYDCKKYKDIKKAKDLRKIVTAFDIWLIEQKVTIDRNIEMAKELKKEKEGLTQKIGIEITSDSIYRSSKNIPCKAYVKKEEGKEYNSIGVWFEKGYDAGKYNIKQIKGKFTLAQLKQIIEIVKEADFE